MKLLRSLLDRSAFKKSYLPPDELFTDRPAGLRARLLADVALELGRRNGGLAQGYQSEVDQLQRTMFQRNAKAMEMEQSGNLDKAIALYEENVADWFDGTHPYDRLRAIYTKRKQYDDAIRVCQAFVEMADTVLSVSSPSDDLRRKRDKFEAWIDKLEGKRQRARASAA